MSLCYQKGTNLFAFQGLSYSLYEKPQLNFFFMVLWGSVFTGLNAVNKTIKMWMRLHTMHIYKHVYILIYLYYKSDILNCICNLVCHVSLLRVMIYSHTKLYFLLVNISICGSGSVRRCIIFLFSFFSTI